MRMKSKFDRVFEAVKNACGNELNGYEAAEVAQHLLKSEQAKDRKSTRLNSSH